MSISIQGTTYTHVFEFMTVEAAHACAKSYVRKGWHVVRDVTTVTATKNFNAFNHCWSRQIKSAYFRHQQEMFE